MSDEILEQTDLQLGPITVTMYHTQSEISLSLHEFYADVVDAGDMESAELAKKEMAKRGIVHDPEWYAKLVGV